MLKKLFIWPIIAKPVGPEYIAKNLLTTKLIKILSPLEIDERIVTLKKPECPISSDLIFRIISSPKIVHTKKEKQGERKSKCSQKSKLKLGFIN